MILERIYKSMVDTMARKGWFMEELFHYLVAYKMKWQAGVNILKRMRIIAFLVLLNTNLYLT